MVKNINQVWSLLKISFCESRKDGLANLAASLTYYLIFSLAPLFYVIISIGGLLYDKTAVQIEMFYYFEKGIGTTAAEFFQNILLGINNTGGHFWPTIISILVLLFGAINFYVSLEKAFHKIYRMEEEAHERFWHFIRRRIISLSFLIVSSFILVLLIFLNLGVNLVRGVLYENFSVYGLETFNFLFAFIFVFVLLFVIYKILSKFKAKSRNVMAGAGVSAFLFVVANFLLGLYFKLNVVTSFYGVGGSIILTLIWLYYSSQIFLFGAEIIKASERNEN